MLKRLFVVIASLLIVVAGINADTTTHCDTKKACCTDSEKAGDCCAKKADCCKEGAACCVEGAKCCTTEKHDCCKGEDTKACKTGHECCAKKQ